MEGINRAAYDRLPADHEATRQYQPRFIARGGEQLVYSAEGHPNIVIKASSFKLKDVLEDNVQKGLLLDEISDEMRASLGKEVELKNAQIRLFRQYFGNEHTLAERRYVAPVPVTRDLLEEMYVKDWRDRTVPDGAERINEAWTTVSIQEKAPQITDPQHLGIYFGGFVEKREPKIDEESYRRVDAVFGSGDAMQEGDLELFFQVQDNPETHALADVIAKAESDDQLRTTLQEFVRTSMRFADETGNILAMAGEDNVIAYPEGERWNYLLVDAVPIPNEPVFTVAREIASRQPATDELKNKEDPFVMRARNFLRTLNGLAVALGIEDRLRL